MSDKEENEIPVEVKNNEDIKVIAEATNEDNTKQEELEIDSNLELGEEDNKLTITELKELLSTQKQKLTSCEDTLKRSLADYQNLQRKTKSDIENGVNAKIDQFMVKFLQIYDDFIRAKTILSEQKVNVEGIESILKNMDSLLSKYDVTPMNSLGEIFNPNLHEAIAVVEDETLDENTITKEIRKGYISHERVIRPAIVEISKKPKFEKSVDE